MKKKTIFNKIISAISKLRLFSVSDKPCKKNGNDAENSCQDKKSSEKLPNWWWKNIKEKIMGYSKNFRKGGKGEYLTQVYMTTLGFSNPTYRQEDFGIDFTCVLTEEINNTLFPIEPFNLQVKSHGKKEDQKLKFKKTNTKDLDWLFKNPNPYFLAWVDVDKTKDIYFYSLSPLWYIDIAKTSYSELIFDYDTEFSDEENVNDHNPKNIIVNTQKINIGKPFMTMSLNDLKDDNKIKEKSAILKRMVKLEKENIQYRSFGIPFMQWLWKFKTNKIETFKFGWSHFCNEDVYKQINNPIEITNNIGHILITLASSFALHNKDKKNKKYEKYHLTLVDLLKELTLNENNYNEILKDLKYIDDNGDFIKTQVDFPLGSLGPTGFTYDNKTEIVIPTQTFKFTKPSPIYDPKRKKKK